MTTTDKLDLGALERIAAGERAANADDMGTLAWKEADMPANVLALITRIRELERAAPQASAGEAVLIQSRCRPTWRNEGEGWTLWEECTPAAAADYERTPILHDWQFEVRRLYAAPQPAADIEKTPCPLCGYLCGNNCIGRNSDRRDEMDSDYPKHVFWHWSVGGDEQAEILSHWFCGAQPEEGASYGLKLVRLRRDETTELTFQLVEIAPPTRLSHIVGTVQFPPEDRFEQSPQG